jgi:hypothetical protein
MKMGKRKALIISAALKAITEKAGISGCWICYGF